MHVVGAVGEPRNRTARPPNSVHDSKRDAYRSVRNGPEYETDDRPQRAPGEKLSGNATRTLETIA
jgi:hypothetical protein